MATGKTAAEDTDPTHIAALQEQQKINAAMTTTLAAQNPTVTTQTVTTSPRVVQPKAIRTQVTQNPNTTTRVVQIPTTPGFPGTGNGTTQQGQVRYIRVPPGTTRATYKLRSCEDRRPDSPQLNIYCLRRIVDFCSTSRFGIYIYIVCVDRSGSLSDGAFNQLRLVTLNIVLTILY